VILHIFDDEQTLARAGALSVTEHLRAHPRTILGLPTGRTTVALYAQLVTATRGGDIDWTGVRTFNLDEFVGLHSDAPQSYRMFMRRHLFDHVNIDPRRTDFPNGAAADLDAECARYDAAIHAAGGIDLQLLGIGANGHVGFNEPAEGLHARTHRVALRDETREANTWWFGGRPEQVPGEAISVGMGAILSAREILLMATGEGKAEAVAAMIEGRVTTWLPASFLQLHPRVTVMLDRAAASKLTSLSERWVARRASP
jgi:glucosamine-6-phosphate deaminase